MKIKRVLILASLFLYLSSCGGTTNFAKFVGKEAPYTRFTMMNGEYESLESFRGKTVFLVFWATTCTMSRSVIERMNELALKYKGRNDLVFLAISIDKAEDLEKLKERIEYGKLTGLRHAFSGNEVFDEAFMAFELDSLPAIFVVTRGGEIRAGGRSASIVEDYIKQL